MWSTIFLHSKLTEILGNISKFQLIKINKTVYMFYISINFKDTKKVGHILESSLDVQSFFDALNVIYQLSEITEKI